MQIEAYGVKSVSDSVHLENWSSRARVQCEACLASFVWPTISPDSAGVEPMEICVAGRSLLP